MLPIWNQETFILHIAHSEGKNITAEAEVKVWSEADVDFRRVVSMSLESQKSLCGSCFKNLWIVNHKKKMKFSMQRLRLCNNLKVMKVPQYDFIYILKEHFCKFLHFYLLTGKKAY